MYFASPFYRSYSFIAGIRTPYRYLLTILFLSCFVCTWLLTCYFAIARTIEKYSFEIERIEGERKRCQEASVACKQRAPRVQSLSLALRKNKTNNGLEAVYSSISNIFDTLAKSQVLFKAYSIEQERDNEWYLQHIMRFDFTGAYPNVINCFETLARSDMLINPHSVTVHYLDASLFSISSIISRIALK
jgi:hypothetical protein